VARYDLYESNYWRVGGPFDVATKRLHDSTTDYRDI
jgi:hypothetical protein